MTTRYTRLMPRKAGAYLRDVVTASVHASRLQSYETRLQPERAGEVTGWHVLVNTQGGGGGVVVATYPPAEQDAADRCAQAISKALALVADANVATGEEHDR